jgi:hypothetical protein
MNDLCGPAELGKDQSVVTGKSASGHKQPDQAADRELVATHSRRR